jgi:aspartyl-tRNA(Asn)/glutamyl-tRNA(Gln) amidotransferase subunit B
VRNVVLRVLNDRKLEIEQYAVTPAKLARLIRLIDTGAIGGKAAKEVFEEMSTSGESPDAIVERLGLSQVSDPEAIRDVARRIIEQHPAQVAQYQAGQQKLFGFLVGQLMKEMRGKANAEVANTILRELLQS